MGLEICRTKSKLKTKLQNVSPGNAFHGRRALDWKHVSRAVLETWFSACRLLLEKDEAGLPLDDCNSRCTTGLEEEVNHPTDLMRHFDLALLVVLQASQSLQVG